MLARKPDWQSRLSQFLLSHQHTRFAYGSFDCCLFVADAIEAMTGTDIAAPFRGAYSTQKAARRFGSVRAIANRVAGEHGMPEAPVLRAHRGDMALVKRSRGYSLGLVDFNGRDILSASEKGIWRVPLSLAACCWHV